MSRWDGSWRFISASWITSNRWSFVADNVIRVLSTVLVEAYYTAEDRESTDRTVWIDRNGLALSREITPLQHLPTFKVRVHRACDTVGFSPFSG